MRRPGTRWTWIAALLVGATVFVAADRPAERRSGHKATAEPAAGETPSEDTPSSEAAAAVPGQAGMRALLDSQTGELLSRPPDDEAVGPPVSGDRLGPGHWLNTYSADLIEERLEGGGYKVDLRGRYQSALVATVDPESGEAAVDCVTGPLAQEPTDVR